jgi:hypothetical protein
MSQFTIWRDKEIASFQKRRKEAVTRFYLPAGISGAAFIVGAIFKWPAWTMITFFIGGSVLGMLGRRHARCPFCKQAILDDDPEGTDPTVCPRCTMRLKS